jgi:hypothetical protein
MPSHSARLPTRAPLISLLTATCPSPHSAKGTEVVLRSNLTIRNTLQCAAVHLLFERLHPPNRDEPQCEYCVVEPGEAYHVPLHLTSNTRLSVRPVDGRLAAWKTPIGKREAHPRRGDPDNRWQLLVPAFPGPTDAQVPTATRALWVQRCRRPPPPPLQTLQPRLA